MVTGNPDRQEPAIEPQLNPSLGGLLANYVRSSFRAGFGAALREGSTAPDPEDTTLAVVRARMVMDGEFTWWGSWIAFQMLGRVTEPILRLGYALAGFSAGTALDRASWGR